MNGWSPDDARRVCEEWARGVLADAESVYEHALAAGVMIAGMLAQETREATDRAITTALGLVPFDRANSGLDGVRYGIRKGRELMFGEDRYGT